MPTTHVRRFRPTRHSPQAPVYAYVEGEVPGTPPHPPTHSPLSQIRTTEPFALTAFALSLLLVFR